LSNEIPSAQSFLERAEKTYRAAIIEIGDDDFRVSYSRRLKNAVEAHYLMMKSVGLVGEAEKLKDRLAQVEEEFAKYLNQ
ncbi:MAG: hypothetical protein ABL984_05610, partial [Pyrinomonadaceae bacterium]